MRILFSALQYPTKDYPFAAFISMMAEAFAKAGHDVTVIAPQSITHSVIRKRPLLPIYEQVESAVFRYPIKIYRPKCLTFGEGYIKGKLTLKSLKFAAINCISKLNQSFDIIYSHFWQAAYQILPYCSRNKIPLVVVSGEDKISICTYLRSDEIDTLRHCVKMVICVSSKNKNESIHLGLATENNIIVIPNGPNLKLFKHIDKSKAREKLGFSESDFIICFVGRFINRKGALRTEQAILACNDKSIKGIFIGSAMADENKSQEPKGSEIIFKGIVPHDKVSIYLNASDVYVLPTLAEGCSNSIVEAMACGLPIISSDRDFNRDVLDDTNAILVDPLNVDEISGAIIELKNNPDRCKKMSESSLEKAQNLSFDKRVSKILTLLKNITDENHRI